MYLAINVWRSRCYSNFPRTFSIRIKYILHVHVIKRYGLCAQSIMTGATNRGAKDVFGPFQVIFTGNFHFYGIANSTSGADLNSFKEKRGVDLWTGLCSNRKKCYKNSRFPELIFLNHKWCYFQHLSKSISIVYKLYFF